MTSAVRGEGGTPNPPVPTIISHRDFVDAANDFANDHADEQGDPDDSLKPTNGTTATTANGDAGDAMINNADEIFERAASATPAAKTTQSSIPTPKSTKSTKSPKSNKSTKAKTPAATTAPASKPSTTAVSEKPKTTWAGASGPDNSITINGEQQWEIASIVGQEGNDILLVKWKGWKGVWEEDRDVIAESVPELVKEWEGKVEKLGNEKASTKSRGRGRPKGSVAKKESGGVGKGKVGDKGAVTARKTAAKAAGSRGRPKKAIAKETPTETAPAPAQRGRKRSTATAAPAPSPAKEKANTRKARAAPAKKNVGATKSPKRSTATKAAAEKAVKSPKKVAGKGGVVVGGKKRGRLLGNRR